MRPGASLLLAGLLFLLPSCRLLDRVERLNATTYLRTAERDLASALRRAPLAAVPAVLYPAAEDAASAEGERAYETARRYGTPADRERIGLLTGHPEEAARSEDPRRRMTALALAGDTVALARELLLHPDPALSYSLYRLRGDSAEAVGALRTVLADGGRYPREVRRRAAWALTDYPGEELRAVEALSRLGEAAPLREWRLLLEGPTDEDRLRRLAARLLAETPRGTLLERKLFGTLRDRLWEAALWPEALTLQLRLPDDRHAAILEYRAEIALLEAYERPDEAPEETRPAKSGSFRDRFGPVRNVNNWAMDYSGYSPAAMAPSLRLTEEEYRALRARLTTALTAERLQQ